MLHGLRLFGFKVCGLMLSVFGVGATTSPA